MQDLYEPKERLLNTLKRGLDATLTSNAIEKVRNEHGILQQETGPDFVFFRKSNQQLRSSPAIPIAC